MPLELRLQLRKRYWAGVKDSEYHPVKNLLKDVGNMNIKI